MRIAPIAVLIGIAICWFFLARPEQLGGPIGYLLVSGSSMEPGYETGDLVLTRRRDGYGTGDIVGFRIPEGRVDSGHLVIHRIVGGDGVDGYVTQGDNNGFQDPWHPTADDVIGKAWIVVPGGQTYVDAITTPQAFIAFTMFLAALGFFEHRRSSRRRHPGPAFLVRS
jgi:signal peptidase